jgi:hypothetical protein
MRDCDCSAGLDFKKNRRILPAAIPANLLPLWASQNRRIFQGLGTRQKD